MSLPESTDEQRDGGLTPEGLQLLRAYARWFETMRLDALEKGASRQDAVLRVVKAHPAIHVCHVAAANKGHEVEACDEFMGRLPERARKRVRLVTALNALAATRTLFAGERPSVEELEDVLDGRPVRQTDEAARRERQAALKVGLVELRLKARVLVIDGEVFACAGWAARWDDLERLAKARKPGQGPHAGCVQLGANAWKRLRGKLNNFRGGLADNLLEQVVTGRYRFRHLPILS